MREIGGYLPLELCSGKEYFQQILEEYVGRYDCGRTALYVAICSLKTHTLWLPYFCCPSVSQMLEALDIKLKYYHITDELLPVSFIRREDETILLINFYGILDEKIIDYVGTKKNIIVDNTQAFFCEPILREGIFNIYSCRKFIGVCDGAYLIGIGQEKMELEKGHSYEYAMYLLKSLESGTDDAYIDNAGNEKRLGKRFCEMSYLTRKMLDGVDYDHIRERRRNNFKYLHFRLKKHQILKLEDSQRAPYCYPLFLESDMRNELIQKRIYVPTLWKELIDDKYKDNLEYRLAKNVLCLPIDQRYDWTDMQYICDLIEKMRRNE